MQIYFQENAAAIVLLVFLIIVFLQSGLDKLIQWKGNASWLKEHFSKTVFRNTVPMLLAIITVLEVLTGILAVVGLYYLAFANDGIVARYAGLSASIALLMLLFGQRIAQDYDGARTIVIYLIPTVFLLYLLD